MSENMRIYEQVRAVPPEALKQIAGGRLKGMSDINPMWRLKKLTEMFGICGIGWKIEITDKRLEKGAGNEVVCFVDINLYVKVDGEWSAPIPGMGGSSFIAQEKSGPFTSDECFKMAYTDAISVACKSLGFAADVYFANDRTKYSDQGERTSPNAAQGQQSHQNSYPNQLSSRPPATSTQANTQAGGASTAARVYKMREEFGWGWPDLTQFASEALGREIKYLKSGVKTDEEWKTIEDAMLAIRDGMHQSA